MRECLLIIFIVIFIGCETLPNSNGYSTYTPSEVNNPNNPNAYQYDHWSQYPTTYFATPEARNRFEDNSVEFLTDPTAYISGVGQPPGLEDGDPCEDVMPKDVQTTRRGPVITPSEEIEENSAQIIDELGAIPAISSKVETPLPKIEYYEDEAKAAGYYHYNPSQNAKLQDRRYGTERTIWRIQAAGKILAKKGIIMGVGDISKKGGKGTNGHRSHQKGVDVDLRFVAPDGIGNQCSNYKQGCNDKDKTFEMIKTMIDVDPGSVRKIFVNDPELIKRVNKYSQERGIGEVAQTCPGHDDHVHISYKN